MRNAGLEEAQAGIKTAGRNINNLRYADDTTLMAEREEELNSLLMKVKEESQKVGLKLNILKIKIIAYHSYGAFAFGRKPCQTEQRRNAPATRIYRCPKMPVPGVPGQALFLLPGQNAYYHSEWNGLSAEVPS